jgi:hypothetical protein
MSADENVGIFEVFRVATIKRRELKSLDEAELRKRFVRMQPVTCAGDLDSCDTLATAPKQGHMIVDQAKFGELVRDKVREAIDAKEQEIRLRADEKVVAASHAIERDRLIIASAVRSAVDSANERLRQSVLKTLSGDVNMCDASRKALDDALRLHSAAFESLFEHALFEQRSDSDGTVQCNDESSAASSSN